MLVVDIVTLFVTSRNASSERRFSKSLTVASLKERLEPITGVAAATMKIQLFGPKDELLAVLEEDDRMLGFYPVQQYMRLNIIDTSPFKINDYSDVSKVEKLEMADDEYDKRTDSVRAFKKLHKMGRFAEPSTEDLNDFHSDALRINVNARCLVEGDDGFEKRGIVKFVGNCHSLHSLHCIHYIAFIPLHSLHCINSIAFV